MSTMRGDLLHRSVQEELVHIPRGDLSQNELRMVYNIERRHDLALDPSTPRLASLRAAVRSVQSRHPSFVPGYDAAFFGG